MTKEDLLKIGFKLCGVEENDPYYNIVFKHPFKFGISNLCGVLSDNGLFLLYGNNIIYSDKEELKKLIDIVGSEVLYSL